MHQPSECGGGCRCISRLWLRKSSYQHQIAGCILDNVPQQFTNHARSLVQKHTFPITNYSGLGKNDLLAHNWSFHEKEQPDTIVCSRCSPCFTEHLCSPLTSRGLWSLGNCPRVIISQMTDLAASQSGKLMLAAYSGRGVLECLTVQCGVRMAGKAFGFWLRTRFTPTLLALGRLPSLGRLAEHSKAGGEETDRGMTVESVDEYRLPHNYSSHNVA